MTSESGSMGLGKKDVAIETLRGLACLMVVTYHVIGAGAGDGLLVTHGPVRLINDAMAYVRMPLFTFVSGMVYALRPFRGDGVGFLIGKARRLLIPLVVVGTSFAVLQAWVPGTHAHVLDWGTLHLRPYAHYWFLEAIFWVFLWICLLEMLHLLTTIARFGLVFSGAVLLYLYVPGTRWLAIDGAIYLFPYFLAGLFLIRFDRRGLLHARSATLMLGAVVIACMFRAWPPAQDVDRNTILALGVGLASCLLLWSLKIKVEWLARIGAYSYAIFLFHVFFAAAARIALWQIGIRNIGVDIGLGVVLGLLGPIVVEEIALKSQLARTLLLGKAWTVSPRPQP
jgi:peptidoglycan/LPS O-acetylase OafA/YrhL